MPLLNSKEIIRKQLPAALQLEVVDNSSTNIIISHDQISQVSQDHSTTLIHNYNSSNNSVISFESAAGHINNNSLLHNHGVGGGGGGSYNLRFDHQLQQQIISPISSNGYNEDYPPFNWEDNTSLINNNIESFQQRHYHDHDKISTTTSSGKSKRNLSRDFNNSTTIQQAVVVEKDQQQLGGWPISSSSQSSSEADMAAINEAMQLDVHLIAITQHDHQSPPTPITIAGSRGSKRHLMGAENSTQAMKKQCINNASNSKTKSSPAISLSKDPQSIAAKNRRERISERLKILQEMVPNGSKVDLVTMLEKAISYVKFLQLQVKVLATDEFWPTAGGKAPNLSQVREAIDAILASHRDTNSTTSSK